MAMAFAQLADAGSLREISLGLASASGKLRHRGIDSVPCRSTLSCANPKRPGQFFADLSAAISAIAAAEAARQGFAGLARRPHGEKGAEAATRLRVVLWLAFWTAGLGIRENSKFKNRGHVLKKAVLEKRMRVFTGIQRGEVWNENYFGQ